MTAQFPTRQTAKLSGHNGPVHAVEYSAGAGQYILTGSADRVVRLFNASRGSLVQRFEGHNQDVLDLAVTDDNARFASAGGDKMLSLWDVATATTLRRFSGHGGRCNSVAFAADGAVLVSGSFDATVKLWDLKSQSNKPLMTLSEAKDSISSVCVRGHEIFAGSIDERLRTYDFRMGQVFVDVIGHPVTSIATTEDADAILASTLDSTIRLMDKSKGTLLQSYKAPEYVNVDYRTRSTFGHKDTVVVAGCEDGSIFAWDVLSGALQHRLWHRVSDSASKNRVVSAVAFCRARNELASAGGDGTVVVWGV